MAIPEKFRKDADAFPAVLRALLDAELAAGNEIAEVGHSFPAPPAGAYFKLKRPVSTRARAAGGELKFRDFNSSIYSGEFTDERGFYFILEPPGPPPPEPDMDAIRAAHSNSAPPAAPKTSAPAPTTALGRFEQSMIMDYDKWHDGIGYDLDVLETATPEQLKAIEAKLLSGGVKDWRDVEALAALDTPGAKAALKNAMTSSDPQIRLAVTRHAPELVPETQRTKSLVEALETSRIYGGLTQALDEAADFHPRNVVDTLFGGVLRREGDVAVHFAALLMYIHGKAEEPFDVKKRPFFLQFNTEDKAERQKVFRELCNEIGVEASEYL